MKKRSNTIFFLLALIFWGCTDDAPRNPSLRPGRQSTPAGDTAKEIAADSIAQRESWVDYVNYAISRHALRNSGKDTLLFDTLTTTDKSYKTVYDALLKIQADTANINLCNEINQLKNDTQVKKNVDTLPVYLSYTIFIDTIKYAKIAAFYKKRIKNPVDSLSLTALLNNIKTTTKENIAAYKDKFGNQKKAPDNKQSSGITDSSITQTLLWIMGIFVITGFFTFIVIRKRNNKASKKIALPVTDVKASLTSSAVSETPALDVQAFENENQQLRKKIQVLEQKINEQASAADKPRYTEPEKETATNIQYLPAPYNNTFPFSAVSNSKRSLDAYQLQIKGSAILLNLITTDNEVVKRALTSPDIYILPLYEIESGSSQFGKAVNIKILEPALLQQDAGQWVLKTKGLIKLL